MLIEREGRLLPSYTREGMDAFANLEDSSQGLFGTRSALSRALQSGKMITRSLTGFRIAPDVEIPIAELQAAQASVNAKLRAVGEHTGATTLDPHTDICGSGDDCLSFFGVGEPKFSDNVHLRPVFVREHLRFLDPLLK
jgi:hypothetical protein